MHSSGGLGGDLLQLGISMYEGADDSPGVAIGLENCPVAYRPLRRVRNSP
jgi:hypothetical protein